MRYIEYFDALVVIGRIDAGRKLSEITGKSPSEILSNVNKTIPESPIEKHYLELLQILGLSDKTLPKWPPKEISDWDNFIALVDQAIRSVDPTLEGYWRLASSGGYLLWVPLPAEALDKLSRTLNEIGIPLDIASEIVSGLQAKDTMTRLSAFERVRNHIRSNDGHKTLASYGSIADSGSNVASLSDVPINTLPFPGDVRESLSSVINEISACDISNCNLAAIILCGKVIETVLYNVYSATTGKDADQDNLGYHAIRTRLRSKGILFEGAVDHQLDFINAYRNKAVHGGVRLPTKDEATAVMLFTRDLLNRTCAFAREGCLTSA